MPQTAPIVEHVLKGCASTLQRVAKYRLPIPVDKRLQWLGEHKHQLDSAQREELMQLADFAEQRTLERVEAQALLQQIEGINAEFLHAESAI